MKDAKWALRDVTAGHHKRWQNAVRAAYEGENLLREMQDTLLALEKHVGQFEGYSILFCDSLYSDEEQKERADAILTWALCLPETDAQVRAGRDREDILQALLDPVEEHCVVRITELSGISEEVD